MIDFKTKNIIMWPNKYIKLSLVLYLTILATLTRGQDIAETTNISLPTSELANDAREGVIEAENLNIENDILKDQITVMQIDATLARNAINGEAKNTNDKSETNVDSTIESATSTECTTQVLDSGNNTQSNIDSATESEINSESATETDSGSHAQSSVDSATESEINSESVTETETDTNVESVTVEDSAIKSTTNQIDCVCDCTANGSKVKLECSTQTTQETQTENIKSSENYTPSNSNSNTNELETTNPAIAEDNENLETTTESNIKEDTNIAPDTNGIPETTTQSNVATETSTLPPSCSTPGVQPHATVCQQYYDCSSEGSLDGSFHLLTKSCPNKQAFNIELNRCSRDLSSCSNPIECLVKGGISDPASNSSYYLCEPRLIGEGFRIFHVACSTNQLFYPELGKCFVDINNLPSQIYPPYYNWNQLQDIDVVKVEMKLLKEQDKFKLKQEKDRIKAEEKLQKQIAKEEKKRAKEEEKLNQEKAKQEAASYVCVQEGNFKSAVGGQIYFACINKKGKLKALVMQCPIGSKFDADSGTCVNNTLTNTGNDADDDDDDDDNDDDD